MGISKRPKCVSNHFGFSYFSIDPDLSYAGFCDDFGPMSLGTIFQFSALLDEKMARRPNDQFVMLTEDNQQTFTNSVFLLGSYMIMRLDSEVDDVDKCFECVHKMLASYRDVSPGKQNFHLRVQDCWAGLRKAKSLGWMAGFHLNEYNHFDSPLNADLHEIIPGKFVAMRGPKDLPGGARWMDALDDDGEFRHRDFSPQHFCPILRQFDVQLVVRLNEPRYDAAAFLDADIAVADLPFPDCSNPPVDVAAKFMTIAESVPGAIAVHCKAGLGRTGTLIALYMMKHHGFTAREAIGWLRIVRPGSVIGPQQQFLCDKEPLMRRAADKFRRDGGPRHPADGHGAGPGAARVQRVVEEVCRWIDARVAAVLPAGLPPGHAD